MIRVLDVGADLLRVRDTGQIEAMVDEIGQAPQLVRQFQGSLAFRFPGQEDGGGEHWEDPAVLAWGRQVHARVPHLLYYMCPEPWAGSMALVCVVFADPAKIAADSAGEQLDAEVFEALLQPLSERLVSAAAFAARMADDWRPIVTELLAPLSGDLASAIMGTVEASMLLAGEG